LLKATNRRITISNPTRLESPDFTPGRHTFQPSLAAVGVLYPFFGLLLSPIYAGTAMTLSSVTVISNALRLRKVRL
jgi:hypothetical protein